jgi:hypothetical protein
VPVVPDPDFLYRDLLVFSGIREGGKCDNKGRWAKAGERPTFCLVVSIVNLFERFPLECGSHDRFCVG